MSRGPPNIDGMVSLKVDNLSYRNGWQFLYTVRGYLVGQVNSFQKRTSTDVLRRKFERYGEIGDAYIPRDRSTGGKT